MKTKEVTLTVLDRTGEAVPVKVTLGYCFATEITYRDLSGKGIDKMFECIDEKTMIYCIISAALAYYSSRNEEPPFKDSDIMYVCKEEEVINAFKAFTELYKEWYNLPDDILSKEKSGEKGKNS